MVTENKIKEIRTALEEIKKEAEELSANMVFLLEKLDEVKTLEDTKNWDKLCDKLISGFSHLDVF